MAVFQSYKRPLLPFLPIYISEPGDVCLFLLWQGYNNSSSNYILDIYVLYKNLCYISSSTAVNLDLTKYQERIIRPYNIL